MSSRMAPRVSLRSARHATYRCADVADRPDNSQPASGPACDIRIDRNVALAGGVATTARRRPVRRSSSAFASRTLSRWHPATWPPPATRPLTRGERRRGHRHAVALTGRHPTVQVTAQFATAVGDQLTTPPAGRCTSPPPSPSRRYPTSQVRGSVWFLKEDQFGGASWVVGRLLAN